MVRTVSGKQNQPSQPKYEVITEKDVPITMPDGVRLMADVYRPSAKGKFPALLSYSTYGKEIQTLTKPPGTDDWETVSRAWMAVEAGNTEYFVSRGYVHIIADARGSSMSEGAFSEKKEIEDGYELIEWIARQPWCNGNVGMLGMSYFAIVQLKIAALNPPHLKAICPVEAVTDYYRHWYYHGGILHYGFFQHRSNVTHTVEESREFTPAQMAEMIKELKTQEELRAYPNIFRTLIMPKNNPALFNALIHPFDGPYWKGRSPNNGLGRIKIPCYLMCRWTAWPIHLPGVFEAYRQIKAPKKLRLYTTPSHITGPNRPWGQNHDHVLRWYDHWLKGIDTGIMDEPPIQMFIQGTNQWRDEREWPLARTRWTKYYLRSGGLLDKAPPIQIEPLDSFVNDPWLKIDAEVPGIKYTTAPMERDTEITGPIALYFNASLSTGDANWMADIKDINPDGTERLVSKGWLRASHRELDKARSKPYQPYHPHMSSEALEPGKVYEYAMEMKEASNVFRAGHRLQLVIKGQDSRREEGDHYFHINNINETRHSIYHNEEYPSYLLLPVI